MLIQGGFGMIAGATGRNHWMIDEQEAKSVADPLETIIENLAPKQKKQIEKYSAPVMLGFAVVGIVLPRIMMDAELSKRRRIPANVPTENRVKTEIGGNPVGSADGGSEFASLADQGGITNL